MIKLEPFTKIDFNRLISWIENEEELIQFAGPVFTFPLTVEQLEIYLEEKNRFVFKIIETDLKQIIGHCEIYLTETSARLCRVLVGEKSFRGKGLGLEVVKLLLDKCFKDINCSQVELNVYDWNVGAIKCYEKAGFKINKDKRKTIDVNGKRWTSINMAIFKND